jgi:hypothetical protein
MPENQQDLNKLEARLASLAPLPPGLDRDRLMYLAGQQAATVSGAPAPKSRPMAAVWPVATAAMTLVSLTLGVAVWNRPERVVERVVYVPAANRAPDEAIARQLIPEANPQSNPTGATPALPAVSSSAAARQLMLSRDRQRQTPAASYLGLRDQVLAMGFESLPRAAPHNLQQETEPSSYFELMQGFLQNDDASEERAQRSDGLPVRPSSPESGAEA